MNHSYSKNKSFNVKIAGDKVSLTLLPCTYMKLISVNDALGEGKTLDDVFKKPLHLDVAIVVYCLLDSDSKSIIDNIEMEFTDGVIEMTKPEKLFYLISDTNIHDGDKNYNTMYKALEAHIMACFNYKSKIKKKA